MNQPINNTQQQQMQMADLQGFVKYAGLDETNPENLQLAASVFNDLARIADQAKDNPQVLDQLANNYGVDTQSLKRLDAEMKNTDQVFKQQIEQMGERAEKLKKQGSRRGWAKLILSIGGAVASFLLLKKPINNWIDQDKRFKRGLTKTGATLGGAAVTNLLSGLVLTKPIRKKQEALETEAQTLIAENDSKKTNLESAYQQVSQDVLLTVAKEMLIERFNEKNESKRMVEDSQRRHATEQTTGQHQAGLQQRSPADYVKEPAESHGGGIQQQKQEAANQPAYQGM